jgi:hypothetical protein
VAKLWAEDPERARGFARIGCWLALRAITPSCARSPARYE